MYIYPSNLKEKSKFALWSLKDITILLMGAILSAVILAVIDVMLPLVLVVIYGFLTVRSENEVTIADYIKFAFRFFMKEQQTFDWRF
ncbi:hypothetical protein [Chakrabartyella piscis]|uniref:hypothetical protein n=1 Tax=Chakrabartyella piscis TaxID=2918914 RepID=UPI0029587F22|nr:hypothetical protein [Chakrabartyella piscis]